ncbi:MAG: tail fiber domain-containing protein [Bdellovibrionales bacterium]|nr:tail fiber domain-containing protein [Bdellovibrionales bacterium]
MTDYAGASPMLYMAGVDGSVPSFINAGGALRLYSGGGNPGAGSAKLGVSIEPSGDVGIGTSAPGAKLEVAGQVKITGGTPGAGKVLTSDATGLASWTTPSGTTQWTTSGSDIYYNTGNVGIGTATPTVPLEVKGSFLVQDAGTTGSSISLTGNTGVLKIRDANDTGYAQGSISFEDGSGFTIGSIGTYNLFNSAGDPTAFGLSAKNNFRVDTNGANRMIITSAGNVGIGTTAPSTKLEVSGDLSLTNTGVTDGTRNIAVAGTTRNSLSLAANDDGQGGTAGRVVLAPGGFSGGGVSISAGNGAVTNGFAGNVTISGGGATNPAGGYVSIVGGTSAVGSDGGNVYVVGGSSGGAAPGNVILGSTSGRTIRGKVGVGTVAPDTKLHVVGTSGSTLKIVDGNQAAGKVLTSDANGVASWSALTGTTQWTTNGSDIHYNTGNVGIGTATPSALLHAVGGVSDFRFSQGASNLTPTMSVVNTGAGGKAGALLAGTLGAAFVYENTGFFAIQTDSKANFTGNALGSGSEKFRIDSSGKVGIGTAAPTDRLHVNGSIRVPPSSRIGVDASIDGGDLTVNPGYNGVLYLSQNAGSSTIQFGAPNWSTPGNTSFALGGTIGFTGGNVGIGTASPSYPLDVRGSWPNQITIGATGAAGSIGLRRGSEGAITGTIGMDSAGGQDIKIWNGSGSGAINLALGALTYPAFTTYLTDVNTNARSEFNSVVKVNAPPVVPAGGQSDSAVLYYDVTAQKLKVSENGGGFVNLVGGSSQWTTSGSDIYYSSGDVSIGTSTSVGGAKFTVDHSGTQWTALTNSDAGGSTWYLASSSTGWSSGGGRFLISRSNGASNADFTIDSSGYVGIGTVSPTAKLYVAGPAGTVGTPNAPTAFSVAGGAGYASGNGNGGGISLAAGASTGTGTGGNVTIAGGGGSGSPSFGPRGSVTISGGDNGSDTGGNVTIRGGQYGGAGSPQLVLSGSGSTASGAIAMSTADGGGSFGATGAISMLTGNSAMGLAAGNISLTAGNGNGVGAGGTINITAGAGGATNVNGADVVLNGGAKGGTGTDGNVILAGTRGFVGVGTAAPGASLEVKGKTADNSSYAVVVRDSANATKFRVRNDGYMENSGAFELGAGATTGFIYAYGLKRSGTQIWDAGTNGGVIIGPTNVVQTMFVGTQVGIGTTSPDQLLSVNGDASKVGGGSWQTFSDARLKTVNGPFTRGLREVLELQPVSYHYNDRNPAGVPNSGDHIGFVAQEIEKQIPEAISHSKKGFLMVNNDPILWTMFNAIKELYAKLVGTDSEVEKLKAENAELKARIDRQDEELRKIKEKLGIE